VLATDDQSKIKLGGMFQCMTWVPQSDYNLEIASVDWDGLAVTVVPRPHLCYHKFKMMIADNRLMDTLAHYKRLQIEFFDVMWVHAGVSEILRTAAGGTHVEVVENLLELKVRFQTIDNAGFGALARTTQAPSPLASLKPFADFKASVGIGKPWNTKVTSPSDANCAIASAPTAWHQILGVTRGFRRLMRMPKCWLFDEVRGGTLPLHPDVDPMSHRPNLHC